MTTTVDGRPRRRPPGSRLGGQGAPPPHDLAAEESLLGAMMLSTEAVASAHAAGVGAASFYRPAHGHVFAAITAVAQDGARADPVTVAAELRAAGLLDEVGGSRALAALQAGTPVIGNAGKYAVIVAEHERARRLIGAAQALQAAACAGDGAAIESASSAIEAARRRPDAAHAGRAPAQPLDEFLNDDDETQYEWLVPGLLERGDRVILTGAEGGGKSTLLRQLAVQVAAGVHPFSHDGGEPGRVLIVDLENSARHVRRQLRPLALAAGRGFDRRRLVVAVRPEGLDLLGPEDLGWLEALVVEHRPELLVIGPLYKLHDGDPTEERPAKAVARALDELRARYGLAVLMEAHQRHAAAREARPERPFGASLWVRWPEFGLHLGPEGELRHWRGQRDEREWPRRLRRGGEWPWTVAEGDDEPRVSAEGRVLEILALQPWQLTRRGLVERVGGRAAAAREAVDHLLATGQIATCRGTVDRSNGRPLGVDLLGLVPEGGTQVGTQVEEPVSMDRGYGTEVDE